MQPKSSRLAVAIFVLHEFTVMLLLAREQGTMRPCQVRKSGTCSSERDTRTTVPVNSSVIEDQIY